MEQFEAIRKAGIGTATCSIIRSQTRIRRDFVGNPALTQSSRLPSSLAAEEDEPVFLWAALRVSVVSRTMGLVIWEAVIKRRERFDFLYHILEHHLPTPHRRWQRQR